MREAEIEALYARLEKPLYNVVYRLLWRSEDARDVVQEAFVRLWRVRERVDARTVDALVYRIALNLAASRRRSRRVWRWVSLESLRGRAGTDADAEAGLIGAGERERVRAALESLPANLRRVVVLCECSDLTQDQIGKLLSIAPGTVASRRHRALALLRRKLSRAGNDDRDVRESV